MSVLAFCRFLAGIPAVLFHEIRARYYGIAHEHSIRNWHPDATMLCRRMLDSRTRVNDFLREWI